MKTQLKKIVNEATLQQLHYENKLLSLITSKTENSVVVTDALGMIEWVNEGFARITGYTLEEVKGKKPGHVLQGPETDPETVALLRQKIQNRESCKTEILNYDKAERAYWISIEIHPVFDNTGSLVQFIALQLDITQQKVQEARLKSVKLMAEKANRAKSEFLSNMSHEIRTPLNAIVSLSELLSKEALPESFRENIEAIYYSAQHLSRVVNDILDFSKIEAQQVKLELASFNFRQTMYEAVNLVFSKSSEKKVPVNLTISPDILTTLTGDKYKLHQILLNLLFNALKFTVKGEVRLDVQLHQETATEAEVQFTITDTGIGIAEEQLKTIFDSFKQVSENTLPPTEGTGLGLAIVKKLVNLHGGRIQVTSKLQKGTCFTLYLPFSKIAAPAQKKESQPLQKQQVAQKRILLAEDNEINQLVYRQIFKKWQAHITIVNNGLEVIECMKHQRYDILILDLQMPHCNGIETTRIVRDATSSVLQHDIPIMALTADALIETKEKALAEGIDAYLVKPVRHDTLLSQILDLLSSPTHLEVEEATSASATPVLDYHFVRSIVGDDQDAFKEILEEFLNVTATDLQELSQHATNAAYLAVRELAHKLKATFRDMDMPTAADLAEALEQLPLEGTAEKRDRLIVALQQAYNAVVDQVRADLQALQS